MGKVVIDCKTVPDLLFDCSRILEYAKIRTILQSKVVISLQLNGLLCTKNHVSFAIVVCSIFLTAVNLAYAYDTTESVDLFPCW